MTYLSGFTFGDFRFWTHFDITGNASWNEAQVVCIADVPSDPSIQQNNAALINHIWRNHLVLAEHVASGKTVPIWEQELTRKVSVVSTVKGWDLPGLEALIAVWEMQEEAIKTLPLRIRNQLQQEKWGAFFAQDSDLIKLILIAPPLIQQKYMDIQELLNDGHREAFTCRIESLIIDVRCAYHQSIAAIFKEKFQARLSSLQATIVESLKSHEKVIVCLSGNFVIRNPHLSGDEYEIKGFRSFLETKKFVVINAKSSPLKMIDQPSLWNQPSASSNSMLDTAPLATDLCVATSSSHSGVPMTTAEDGVEGPANGRRRIQRSSSSRSLSLVDLLPIPEE